MADLKIGDEVYIHGYIDEIRKDTVIIRNDGGYFGTATEEIIPTAQSEVRTQMSSADCISRQAAIDAINALHEKPNAWLDSAVDAVMALPSAQPEPQWIPCSEKLPEDGRYLCTYENDEGICVDFGRVIDGAWWVMPIAWMPLPEPYKEGEQDG